MVERMELCPRRRWMTGQRHAGLEQAGRVGVAQRMDPAGLMNRIFSVVRSMTEKIIELSRGVVTAPIMGKVTAESESISSTCRW